MKTTKKTSDPGEAALPEGWETLSVYSRRELMKGARLPGPEHLLEKSEHPKTAER
jgi:hypothetical protein